MAVCACSEHHAGLLRDLSGCVRLNKCLQVIPVDSNYLYRVAAAEAVSAEAAPTLLDSGFVTCGELRVDRHPWTGQGDDEQLDAADSVPETEDHVDWWRA